MTSTAQPSETPKQKIEEKEQLNVAQRQEIRALRSKHKQQREALTIFRSPVRTLLYFAQECLIQLKKLFGIIQEHWAITFAAIVLLLGIYFSQHFPGPHVIYVKQLLQNSWIGLEWLVLGILSSVGLGTGLHTFVLYLGPFIAKVTLAATECGTIDFDTYGKNAFICPAQSAAVGVTIWQILRKVQFEALIFGLGTAMGELPPYFVARAARLSGKKLEDIEGDNDEDDEEEGEKRAAKQPEQPSFLSRLTAKGKSVFDFLMGNRPFITILLMASVPNPLFDLAGLTCGYNLIPFFTFFSATVLGKAVVKIHLQAMSVITVFSKEHLETLVHFIDTLLPFMKGSASSYFAKERARFHPSTAAAAGAAVAAQPKSILSTAWDVFLVCMLAAFGISIINSTAQARLVEVQQNELTRLRATLQADAKKSAEKSSSAKTPSSPHAESPTHIKDQ